METRYCIEYVNPRHPFRDNGSINVRYDRVLTLEQAEHDLTIILSFGGKIFDLYMGNVVDGETEEWSPKPMIIDDDDWFTTDWIKSFNKLVEVKEVDLDFQTFAKEMDAVFNLPSTETTNTEEDPLNWEYAIAKHFFELGLKAKEE